ncbi:MAG TPA: acyl-CoA dehydrogenase family protein [Pseudonocardia sp.]|nr:acyl-CoA dehydrogenase family protein [Pseudonocardia sp.]
MTAPPEVVSPAEVEARFRDGAADVDGGSRDARDGLRWLGERDLIAPKDGGLPHTVALVEVIAGGCLSSAFSLWAHRMVVEYLRVGSPGGDSPALAAGLTEGTIVGSTAMAPALRDVAGLEPVPVTARRTATGLVLDGPIRWASNLFDDAVMVLPARLPDGADGPVSSDGAGRAVVRIRLSDPGVLPQRRPELLALNGTASGSVQLRDVEVPASAVLATDLGAFVRRIRPAFLLSQSAFCAGLAVRAAAEAGEHTGGANAVLAGDVRGVAERAAAVHERLHAAAAGPDSVGPADLLRLRLDAASVAVAATRLEATVRGGAGYVAGSDVSRRLREAAFLPIQAPTEGQLRWELSRFA